MKSLLSKLLFVSFTSMFLIVLVLGTLSITSIHKVIDENASTIMENICETEKEKINNILRGIEQSVNIISSLAEESITDLEMLEEEVQFNSYNEQMIYDFLNVTSNTPGVLTFYYRYNVSMFDSTTGFWYGLKDGKMTSFPPTDLLLYDRDDIENAAWYYIPFEKGHACWLEPYLNQNYGQYMISYVSPVYFGETFIGVVGMDIDFQILADFVDEIKIYEDGYAYLLNEESKIVYHKDLNFNDEKPKLDTNYVEVGDKLNNDMYLMITASKKIITKDGHELLVKITIYSLILVLIGMSLMLYLTIRIIRPLKELTIATQKVQEGDYDINIKYHSKDEVGILSTSFQKTIDTLNDKMEYINGLVYKDSLTGYNNNTAYDEHILKINNNIENSRFAVAVFDVNFLKVVNDKYGHQKGNELLKTSSDFINSIFSNSKLYRIGGDEFVVILENFDYERKEYLFKIFKENVSNQFIETVDGYIPISVAIGMSEFNCEKDNKFLDVFNRADKEMYKNKDEIKKNNNMGV